MQLCAAEAAALCEGCFGSPRELLMDEWVLQPGDQLPLLLAASLPWLPKDPRQGKTSSTHSDRVCVSQSEVCIPLL